MTNLQPISFQKSRRVDRVAIEQYGMTGLVLMENAGANVARRLAAECPGGSFVILCGKGNNGGDGYVIARHLQLHDCDVKIVAVCQPHQLQGDAKANALIAQRSGIPLETFDTQSTDWMSEQLAGVDGIVDCLLGTGSDGPVRDPYRMLIQAANASPAKRYSVDVPSGWPAVLEEHDAIAFRAERTLTFVAPKQGMTAENADPWVGVFEIVDIGVPLQLLRQLEIWPG